MAENEGRLVRQDWFELAAPNLRIEHIQTGGMHFDEDVVFAKNWLGRFAQAQGALLAIAVENEGFHALRIFPVSPVGYEGPRRRSEEHTSELQSLKRLSYAVFCLIKINMKAEAVERT